MKHYNAGKNNPNWGGKYSTYGKDNPHFGTHRTEEDKRKISIANSDEGNGMWKGDDAGYIARHEWVHRRLPKPEKCQNCHNKKAIDLANISGEYKRDITDWWYLCRTCHMNIDGRMERLHKKTGHFHSCNHCGKEHWVILSMDKKGEGKCCSVACYNKNRKKVISSL
jgi:hypothetical protein